MEGWDKFLTDRDRRIFQTGEFGFRVGFGQKTALIIIDCNYNFVGEEPLPLEESVSRWPLSCGQEGWDAVAHIAGILPLARLKGIPVIYANPDSRPTPPGWQNVKSGRRSEIYRNPRTHEIVREIAPAKDDYVIHKYRPSIFFGTHIIPLLNSLQVDSLIICGTTTSGCVRASVVDAFSYGYKVTVIQEATFDRGEASHWINLFDMNAKYADVLPISEVRSYIEGL